MPWISTVHIAVLKLGINKGSGQIDEENVDRKMYDEGVVSICQALLRRYPIEKGGGDVLYHRSSCGGSRALY